MMVQLLMLAGHVEGILRECPSNEALVPTDTLGKLRAERLFRIVALVEPLSE